jgi:hypothetical protein
MKSDADAVEGLWIFILHPSAFILRRVHAAIARLTGFDQGPKSPRRPAQRAK